MSSVAIPETATFEINGTPTPATVLLIEDDVDIARAIASRLTAAGFVMSVSHDGAEGLLAACRDQPFDAIVLDRRLPSMDGLAILDALRTRHVHTPVLMLTALDRLQDRVDGLERGADDYLIKPFAFEELCARVTALVRRRRREREEVLIDLGELRIDVLQRRVWRAGEPIMLQPREFRLLEVLARNAGSLVSRMMLLEQVWGYHFDPQTKVVQTHLSRLRSKLNAGGRLDLIETVRSVGYRMSAT